MSLKVNFKCKILKAPSIASLSHLKRLVPRDVEVADEGFFKWISCSCKWIEDLGLLVFGVQNIIVVSSSLKSFRFESYHDGPTLVSVSGENLKDISIHWSFPQSEASGESLTIFAPNLESLCWDGHLMHSHNLGKLTSLGEDDLCMYDAGFLSDSIIQVLCILSRVHALTLNSAVTEALFRALSSPIPFDNLFNLEIEIVAFFDEVVQAMPLIFGGMHNLSSLCINMSPYCFTYDSSGFNMEFWKLQNFAFISQLTRVHLKLFCGSPNGIKFERFILMPAPNLCIMTIICKRERAKAVLKLQDVKVASSTADLTIEVDENEYESD